MNFGHEIGVCSPFSIVVWDFSQYNSFELMLRVIELEGMSAILVQASHFKKSS